MNKKDFLIEMVSVLEMRIDDAYQRNLQEHRVREIVVAFDEQLIGILDVSLRKDGHFYVIDGQHRYEAMKAVGRPARVHCRVFEGLSVAEEAELFIGCNRAAKVRPDDEFKAALCAGRETEMEIADTIGRYGYVFGRGSGRGRLCCASTLRRIYRMGPKLLNRVLAVSADAWGRGAEIQGEVLAGLAVLLDFFNGEIKDDALAKRLAGFTGGQVGILGAARTLRHASRGSMSTNVADVIRADYNSLLRGKNRLPSIRA